MVATTTACTVWFALTDPYGGLGESDAAIDAASTGDAPSEATCPTSCASSCFSWNDASTCFTLVSTDAGVAAITSFNDELYILDRRGAVSQCSDGECASTPTTLFSQNDAGLGSALLP